MRRSTAAAAMAALATLLAGCAPAPSSPPGLDALLRDRDRVVLEVHEAMLDRLAGFLRNNWGPVTLPEESVERFVVGREWAAAVAACIGTLGFPGVRTSDEGQRLDFSAVDVETPRENYEIDVATYRCYARFPVRTRNDARIHAVEAPWAHTFTRTTQLPCIAATGHPVSPLPELAVFAAVWRTDAAYDPFALITDPASRARAEARCTGPERMLDAAIDRPDRAEAVAP
ncbi:MAG TPA: hypothetical protein VFM95_03550 [Microcella sp.]|nr:hypothetical protein [Microcella sp.]